MTSSTAILTTFMLIVVFSLSAASSGHQLQWFQTTSETLAGFNTHLGSNIVCKGTIGECMAGDVEFEVDSESTRHMLQVKKYISYGALSRNSVPCSRRGASYYNCRKGAQANPYSRGCSTITRCRH